MTGRVAVGPSDAGMLAEVRGLTVGPAAGGPPVLGDASLAVPAGQVLGVVGRSGSGKSTLAHALLGHVRPGLEVRTGTVRVAGLDPFDREGSRRLRGKVVSFLGQDPASSLNPALRIGVQIAEAVRLRSMTAGRENVRTQVAALLQSVRLPADRNFRRRLPRELSGGQAQRVALALALAGRPRLLVLDEPTSGLDPVLADGMRGLLAETLADGSRAALLVSHDPAWIGSVSDEVIRLERGRIVGRGTPVATRPARPPVDGSSPGEAPRSPAAASDVLLVRGLHAAHGPSAVLHDVSLTVSARSCTAVVGASGSGKTTLARCLAGLHPKTAGSVEWRGGGAPRGRGVPVQLVAQDARGALNPRESVAAALMRPLRGVGGRSAREASEEAVRLLGLVGLDGDVLGRRPGELSGGQRQRVALARTLAAGPRVLVCDEVTSALDPETARRVLDLLDELRGKLDLAVVMVTHDLVAAASRADQVVVLDEGRVVEAGRADRVLVSPEHAVTRRLLAHAGPVVHTPVGPKFSAR
ncbi:ATP-binding cassette domain-containing protein [Streptomyces sp. SID9124]|uniref:ABC transporter ATP-binding protein n=1 Tax=Streptomyces sp. SID9124 TaxID=2706108 RepID=UPI0013DF7E30|nr:ATP-binding cassette domain-containing protein [Streptomyces sp. SID9124]NED12982.1 ABC transporter ATP-binding protein [Streptomyces sp. SID9124]